MYISNREVQQRYSISRTTLWRRVNEGKMPPPREILGLKRWSVADLEKWEKSL
ncbi:helix-turn-helix transcriptional regulator [Methylonatrum kenyense]|uniref:helix-turn-helix transcriptional regulator n=1 Tax=Methylonatrum kenyense TaxID=455253 RepID=UPI003D0CA244